MLTVLGIDLASATWRDNGSAQLVIDSDAVRRVTPGAIAWPDRPLSPDALADAIDTHMRGRGICAVALDGPQGWRDPETPDGTRGVGRRCELACQTQGKTGPYGVTYPRTQRRWIEFSIAVFDSLLARPGVVLVNAGPVSPPSDGYLVLECFPTSAWRSSGITPLPGKARRPRLSPYADALSRAYALPPFEVTSHDDLQAVVAALCAAGVVGGPLTAHARGRAAFSSVHPDGVGRRVEGIIWDVEPTGGPANEMVPPDAAVARQGRSHAPPTSKRDVGPAPSRDGGVSTVRVTRRVLGEVERTKRDHAKMIAIRNLPGGTRAEARHIVISLEGEEYVLVVGDSHAVWRSHQNAATIGAFDSLFALLARRPDHAVVVGNVREVEMRGPDTAAE